MVKLKLRNVQFLYGAVVAVIFIWGVLLRIPELVSGNFLFGHDQGRDYLAAYNIVENHKLTLIGSEAGSGVAGINGIFHGPGYYYLLAAAYAAFQGDPAGGQLMMVFFGVLTMCISWFVGVKMLGKIGSVVVLFFTAVSPLIVSQSRFIWSVHPLSPFILLALYCMYRIPKNPRLYASLAIFCAGLTYHFQIGIAIPFTVSIFIALALVYKIRDFRVYVYGILAAFLAFLPMVLFEIRHNYLAVQSGITYMLGSGGQKTSPMESTRIVSHLLSYWYHFTNTFTFEFGWIPNGIQKLFLYAVSPFIAIQLFQINDKILKYFAFSMILMTIVTFAGYLLLNNVIWDYYLTHLRFAYILVFAIAISATIRQFISGRHAIISFIAAGLFILVMLTGSFFRMYIGYTIDVHDDSVYEKIQWKRSVIDTIYKDADKQPFSLFVFMPSVYTWPYDYLFITYGKRTYGYGPDHEKKGLSYLIIEPDKDKPWRHKGWLETIVQGGVTSWNKIYPNGLILEKKVF